MHNTNKYGKCKTTITSCTSTSTPPALQQPTQQVQHILPLNWSHFKTEEDAEGNLLRTNNWMDTHQFQEGVKVQRFCLPLVGEDRLWYESLRPNNVDWQGLQNQFRQEYSKKVTLEMHGDNYTLMKIENTRWICYMHKTGSYTFRLWRTTKFRGIQKHTSYKIILGIISYGWFKTSSRNSKKNTNERKDR